MESVNKDKIDMAISADVLCIQKVISAACISFTDNINQFNMEYKWKNLK